MNNIYTLYNDDCFSVMEQLIAQGTKINCIIADVPYNINYAEWDKTFNTHKAIELSYNLLTDNGNFLLFQGWSNVADTVNFVQNDTDFCLQNWIVYDRIKGRGAKHNFTSTREDILWLTKSKEYTFNKIYSNIPKKSGLSFLKSNGQKNRSLSNVWYDITPIVPWSKERNGHPTQKPEQLMERCVTIFSNPGDTVLDFCMGSGTTGIAALKLERKFIGIEKNKQWFDVSKERIESLCLTLKTSMALELDCSTE